MLKVRDLKAFYGRSQALFGMELSVGAGEVVTLMGRNGMGKTTTVHAIMGVLAERRGSIEFDGRRIDQLPSFRIARLGLGLVPEGRQIFPNLSVRENLYIYGRYFDLPRSESWRRADELLEFVIHLVLELPGLLGDVAALGVSL